MIESKPLNLEINLDKRWIIYPPGLEYKSQGSDSLDFYIIALLRYPL
ncbi:hypothetical protein J2S17_003326 [Cytobacillus purgationiresistens]|uniref:Uncharacterized protein n=1 Tax=Cytobacillus purgationiresistens TaxID=863449 RepID=A0ABU0AJK4_9BACI|nr:hypothetical protein [Cytobacillus purgationiresistens]